MDVSVYGYRASSLKNLERKIEIKICLWLSGIRVQVWYACPIVGFWFGIPVLGYSYLYGILVFRFGMHNTE